MEMKRYRITVRGVVQGVGYRYFTLRQAERLGIKGWVRNMEDGSVRVVCEGESDAVEEFISLLEEGPPFAKVDEVEVLEEPYKGEFDSFEIRF